MCNVSSTILSLNELDFSTSLSNLCVTFSLRVRIWNEMLPQETTHLIQTPCYQWGSQCQDPWNEVPPHDTTHLILRPGYQRESLCQDPAGNRTTWRPPDHRKEMQTEVVWSCLSFIRSGQNNLARQSERGKKTRQTDEEVGRQHQGMDRPGVCWVPKGSGELLLPLMMMIWRITPCLLFAVFLSGDHLTCTNSTLLAKTSLQGQCELRRLNKHSLTSCVWACFPDKFPPTSTLLAQGCKYLGVTCHLHFWQNDQGLLRVNMVTQGWDGHWIRVHTES